ncbi:MAG: hypothetical protein KME23_02595 [Goleter apudmare HA4340-LM2]|jgi:hypothetical protein|nr:hypothetical protein [Goleter apudmare HA4340-LM2]
MKIAILQSLITVLFIVASFGCSNPKSTDTFIPGVSQTVPPTTDVSKPEATPVAQSNVTATDKIKFKTAGGSDLFSLKQQADGTKLVDGQNQELARIKTDKPGKIKIKNVSEKVLGYVVTAKGSWKLKNPEQNQDLYILRRQNDGDYKLEDAAKKEVYRIRASNDGLKIETPDKQLVYQVKVKGDKTSLRKASAQTIFYTKSGLTPIAFACFGFDVLTREQQAALAYAVNSTGGQ